MLGLGPEARELVVADDLEANPIAKNTIPRPSTAVSAAGCVARIATRSGRATNHRIAPCSQKTVKRLRHQKARPCKARIAWYRGSSPFPRFRRKMCNESRAPHSVTSAATSQDRGDNTGDRKHYNHASCRRPVPHQTSAILASRSGTLSIHTSVTALRMVPRPTSAAMVPVTTMTERAGRSRGAHRSVRAAAARRIGGSPTARHRGAIAKRSAGGASPPLPAQHAMFEDMPQGGARRAFDEFGEQKRHVVVRQFVGRGMPVEGRQKKACKVLAAAGFPVEQGLDPMRVERRVVGRRGLDMLLVKSSMRSPGDTRKRCRL